MKVALFTPYYLPTIGGAELYVHDLANFLKEKNCDISIFTTNIFHGRKNTVARASIPIWRFNVLEKSRKLTKAFISMYLPAENIFKKVGFKDFNIFHFHNVTDMTFPVLFAFSKKPKILTCHTLYEVVNYHYIVGPRFFCFKNILNRMNVLHVLSNNDIKILHKLGIREDKIFLIPPGIRVDDFHASPERQGNKILFVGRISPEKGIETLLKALSKLNFDFKLWIIGPIQDARYLSWLMDRFYEMFSNRTVEIFGPLSKNKLIEYYAKADLFVLPSKMETFGLVLLEAMASKLPVISTKVGAAEELIKDWENGFIVPVGNYKLMAERISIIMKNDKMRMEMGERNKEVVKEKYDLEKNFGKILALYYHLDPGDSSECS